MLRVTPCCIDFLLPGKCGSNVGEGLRAGDEDKVETALEVVCLERAAYRGGDLEGGLAEGNRGKGNAGRGY